MRDMGPREAEYKAKGVEILAINVFEDTTESKAWIASSGLNLHWAFADETVTDAFGVSSVPSQIIIDREGKIAWTSSLSSLMGGADEILTQLDATL